MTSNMTWSGRRDKTVAAIAADVPGFSIIFKDRNRTVDIIDGIFRYSRLPKRGILRGLWDTLMAYNQTLYPRIFMRSTAEWTKNPDHATRTLQHEWVHLKDAQTFFGLLPKKLRYLNVLLFSWAYTLPQSAALVALLAPIAAIMGAPPLHWLLLLGLLFLVPIPSPGRMIAEMRAYRRSRELGGNVDVIISQFTSRAYWWMWPFKAHVRKLLEKPSPYGDEMDVVFLEEDA